MKKIRVACVGDSITYGLNVKNRKKNSYPSVLKTILGKNFEVGNFGNSGKCVIKNSFDDNGKSRNFNDMKEYKDALAMNADIVIINLGINDIRDWYKAGDKFEADYSEIINSFKNGSANPEVFIWCKVTPLFVGQQYYNDPRLEMINSAIKNVAESCNVKTIDMYEPLKDHSELFPDFLHPNKDGANIIAHTVFEAIK